jgi:hypothetical protein
VSADFSHVWALENVCANGNVFVVAFDLFHESVRESVIAEIVKIWTFAPETENEISHGINILISNQLVIIFLEIERDVEIFRVICDDVSV